MFSSTNPLVPAPAPETFKAFLDTMSETELDRWARFYEFVKPSEEPKTFQEYLKIVEKLCEDAKTPKGGKDVKNHHFEHILFDALKQMTRIGLEYEYKKNSSGKP